MDMNLQQLKDALQILALPIKAQVYLDQNEVGRVERLRNLFRSRYCLVHCELNGHLSQEQKQVLDRLDGLLFGMNPESYWLVWSEEKLRNNANWRKVRVSARKALIRFNWPLELPSKHIFRFQPVDIDTAPEQQLEMSCCFA